MPNGQALSYIYYESGPGRRSSAAKLLSKDEARRIAANIAKLPELLQRGTKEVKTSGTEQAMLSNSPKERRYRSPER
jgi:hypothetical protein